MKWLRFAIKNVLRNRRRSMITILIATVGTASVLVGGGFALFTYESLREMSARDSGHVIIAHPGYFDQEEETPMALGLENQAGLRQVLEQDERVRMAIPRLQFSGLISNGDKSTIFTGAGVDPEGEFYVKGPFLTMESGSTLSARPVADQDPQVMLGNLLARQLNVEVGDSLTLLSTTVEGALNAMDVRVQGIFSVGVPEMDKRALLVALPTAQELLLTDKVSTLSVYLYETGLTAAMRADIERERPGYAYQSWEEQAYYYVGVRALYNRIFGLLGVVIVSMVFFAVANTVSTAVVERTREIGTLRAMGTLPMQIMRNFVLEGVVIGLSGAVCGMLLAGGVWLLFHFAEFQMPPPPGRSEGYPLYIIFFAELYAITAITIVVLCMLAAWFSSRKAAGKPIVEALTHV